MTVSKPAASPGSDRPEASLLAALERAESLLTPTTSVPPGRLFRRPLLLLQSLLFRALRPYWFQQRESHRLLIQALREVTLQSARAAATEPGQRQALESVWQKVQDIESAVARAAAAEPGQRQALESAWQKVQDIESAVAALRESVSTFQASAAHHLAELTGALAATTERVGAVEAAAEHPGSGATQVAELSHRLYAVPYMDRDDRFYYTENGKKVLGFRSGPGSGGDEYLGFEDIFRGSEAFIRERQKVYLPILTKHGRVVEIGSGRGEMLDLLRDAGVSAVGVDTDEGMVRRCRSRGHDVQLIDGIAFLSAQPDGSLPAIFCAQVVEHLPYDEFLRFLQVALAKLQPCGQLVFETVNPHAIEAFKTFYTDLTHQRPIFPEVALAWCWLTGFAEAYVMFPTSGGDLETDRRTRGEYAVIATKEQAVG